MRPTEPVPSAEVSRVSRSAPVRWAWFATGWVAVGLGAIGIVVPGLPTTVFFIVAASCFARSSPRFEQWVLNLPRIGPLVRDYRSGLGMPRRAKAVAIAMIVVAVSLSAVFGLSSAVARAVVVGAGLVGVGWILWRVPTRERVLAERGA